MEIVLDVVGPEAEGGAMKMVMETEGMTMMRRIRKIKARRRMSLRKSATSRRRLMMKNCLKNDRSIMGQELTLTSLKVYPSV